MFIAAAAQLWPLPRELPARKYAFAYNVGRDGQTRTDGLMDQAGRAMGIPTSLFPASLSVNSSGYTSQRKPLPI